MAIITDELANMILVHLKTGGTRLEADCLANRLLLEANEPQREAAIQERISQAVAKALEA
jgi:hypothetical protein